jgi:hypothetical protein
MTSEQWIMVGAGVLLILFVSMLCYYFCFHRESFQLKPCVDAHCENGLNYPWLNQIHGGLAKIQYKEPVDTGEWRDYTDEVWAVHCKVIDHTPENLVDAHVKAFITPDTRFAKLMFYFKDGTAMEPTREFYELEQRWFAKV